MAEETKYLMNTETLNVFVSTERLEKRSDMIACDVDGDLEAPKAAKVEAVKLKIANKKAAEAALKVANEPPKPPKKKKKAASFTPTTDGE